MSNTTNLDLRTDFTGMGLTAGSQLGENFRKIDDAMGNGGGGTPAPTPTGADVVLTGYAPPEGSGTVAATDTVNEAIAKLEEALAAALSRIDTLENPVPR